MSMNIVKLLPPPPHPRGSITGRSMFLSVKNQRIPCKFFVLKTTYLTGRERTKPSREIVPFNAYNPRSWYSIRGELTGQLLAATLLYLLKPFRVNGAWSRAFLSQPHQQTLNYYLQQKYLFITLLK